MKQYLQTLFDSAVEEGVFPGCVASVYYQGKWTKIVSGKKAMIPQEEMNSEDTLYDLASLSKVVSTTMIVLKLIEEGKMLLSDDILQYLPDCPFENMDILSLLTHTSGLPPIIEVDRNDTKESIYNKICHIKRQHTGEVVYSDVGYILLQFVLEALMKKSLDEIAKNYVFKPLGMLKTMYCPNDELKELCAPTEISPFLHRLLRGEVHDEKAYQLGGVAGHAGVFSCIEDMEKYATMMLNDTFLSWPIKKLCYQPALKHMTIPRGIGFLTSDKKIGSYLSATVAYHTGFCGNSILLDYDKQIAIIVLSNRVHPTRNNEKILEWRKTMHDAIYCYLEESK